MESGRLEKAFIFAAEAHRNDTRKGTSIPYVSHLLQVAGLVLELGGDEDEAIGGLLHDVAEDAGGECALQEILERFGPTVELIVRQNSDSLTGRKTNKAPWRERKEAYLDGIALKSTSALLVSICDKIHNARSLNADSRFLGPIHWSRFNASKEDSLWYYENLLLAFDKRRDDDPRFANAIALFRVEVDALNYSDTSAISQMGPIA